MAENELTIGPCRFGPIPTDLWFCRACGRALRSIEGHDRPRFCYGCGALALESTREDSPSLGSLFGEHGWWPLPAHTSKIEVEYPADYHYDPWSGELMVPEAGRGGPTQEEIQIGKLNALIGSIASC
jgi:hypothetical protein